MNSSKVTAGNSKPEFASGEPAAYLSVRSAEQMGEAPDDASQLLLGFEFGTAKLSDQRAGVVSLALEPLTAGSATESWWYAGTVEHRRMGPVRLAECKHYSALIIEWAEGPQGNLKLHTQEAYAHLLTALSSARHKRPVRIWNYFDGINDEQNQLERYQSFSSGRANAFARFGIDNAIAPVGTAIGTSGSNTLTLIALASDLPFDVMENPRQVSAYDYPSRYGPDSPRFSRSGLLRQSSGSLFLVSGTAAVIGHDSAFPFECLNQFRETLKNLNKLLEQLSPSKLTTGFGADSKAVLRVYLRDGEHQCMVSALLRDAWGGSQLQLSFLQGDICRRELMLEIEAVIVL